MASSVIWNQRGRPLTADNWKSQNASYTSLSFEDGVVTRTMIADSTQVYHSSIVLKNQNINFYKDRYYYQKQELYTPKSGSLYTLILANLWTANRIIPANEWTTIEYLGKASADRTGSGIYLTYCSSQSYEGDICKCRNPILVDLTQMFGEGNEPTTVEEFRRQCEINGINLDSALPYDTGTEISWRFDVTSESLLTARRKILLNEPHIETTNGDVGNFKTDMKAPLKECKISFEPLQEGSGDPSPSNIRPIKGYNRLTLQKAGKNICEVYGWSAQNSSSPLTLYISNDYGSTLSTTLGDSVTITQTRYSQPNVKSDYNNGYLSLVSKNLRFGKSYNISFDITDIVNNPLNASLSNVVLYDAGGSAYHGTVDGDRVIFRYVHRQHPTTALRNSDRIAIRICGMSCTISNVMITPVQDEDIDYEDYCGEETALESPLPGKNIADIYCFSAITNPCVYFNGLHNQEAWALSNTYGTTISTCSYSGPDTSLVVSQTSTGNPDTPASYKNGYFCIGVAGLSFGTKYKVSFKISNIVNNPLNANLTNMSCYAPYSGSGYATVDGDRVIFEIMFNAYLNNGIPDYDRQYVEVRNCGMSFTASEFMITEDDETDQTYEPYQKTMYGGYLDLVNNEFVQEWECVKMDPSWSWSRYEPYSTSDSHHFVQYYANNLPESVAGQHDRTVYSNMFRSLGNVNAREYPENNMTVYRSSYAYCFRYDEIETVEDWKSFITANDVWVAGKLVTPIHHLLTPQLLKSLRGTNNILTDIPSEVEVKYWTH